MSCDDIKIALADFSNCEPTSNGSRIATHCVYPSFDPVRVYVAKFGDGFIVHDDGGAYRNAWLHGRDEAMIKNSLKDFGSKFHLVLKDKVLTANVDDKEWLGTAIIGVANASSLAAYDAVAKLVASAEEALVDRIGRDLEGNIGPRLLAKNVEVRGVSGGYRHFDFAIGATRENPIYINGILPHKNSIASKYVAFADTDVDVSHKLAVHDKPLHSDDTLLLRKVAVVLPLASLKARTTFARGYL
jgi:hypothetical protein